MASLTLTVTESKALAAPAPAKAECHVQITDHRAKGYADLTYASASQPGRLYLVRCLDSGRAEHIGGGATCTGYLVHRRCHHLTHAATICRLAREADDAWLDVRALLDDPWGNTAAIARLHAVAMRRVWDLSTLGYRVVAYRDGATA